MTNNKTILKALRTKEENITQVQIEELGKLGIEIVFGDDMSDQGYVTLERNGKQLVISKGKDNRTYLYRNNAHGIEFSKLKYVDFMNYFDKDTSYKIGRISYRNSFPLRSIQELKDALNNLRWDVSRFQRIEKEIEELQKRSKEASLKAEQSWQKVNEIKRGLKA